VACPTAYGPPRILSSSAYKTWTLQERSCAAGGNAQVVCVANEVLASIQGLSQSTLTIFHLSSIFAGCM
jgi:hypothetical protein